MIKNERLFANNLFLKDKTALVTGAARGIGRACAESLARSGAYIHLLDMNGENLKLTKSYIEENNGKCSAWELDLTDENALIETLTKISDSRPIHILINNAGSGYFEKIESYPIKTWRYLIDLLLTVPFITTRFALAGMKIVNWGRIINISSIHGLNVYPYNSAYTSAKHGLIGFTKAIAIETADFNISANSICPGTVLTPSVEDKITELVQKEGLERDEVIKTIILKRQPKKKIILPEIIADYVLYLCSPAADLITGSNVVIDGGRQLT